MNKKKGIHYLKQTGLYKINNLIFSVASIFDRRIIDIAKIKQKNEVKILLHHGLVVKCKNSLLEDKPYFITNDFKDYDIVLLGDIHKHAFIKNNIAYAGSLIQRNFGELINGHGIIKWDVKKKSGEFIEILNDYGLLVKKFIDGKEVNDKTIKLPKNLCIKVQLEKTNKEDILKNLDSIKKKYKINGDYIFEGVKKEYNMKLTTTKQINSKDITKISILNELMDEYINNNKDKYKFSKDKITKLHLLNSKYYNNVKIKKRDNKEIKFEKILFSNVFNYGSNNVIKFKYDATNTVLIDGLNGYGKSSIMDIICFVLFDKTMRTNNKADILNINKNKFSIDLHFSVEADLYRIIKTGEKKNNKIIHTIKIYKNGSEIKEWTKRNYNEYIQELLGFDYIEFIYLSFMAKESNNEIIDKTNLERQELISNILNLNFFDEIYEKVKIDYEKKRNYFLEHKNDMLNTMNNYTNVSNFNKDEYEKIKQDMLCIEEKINILNIQIKQNRKNIKYTEEIKTSIEDINDELKHNNMNIQKNKEILKEINKDISEINEKKKHITIDKVIHKKIEQYYKDCFAHKTPKNDIKLLLYDIININIDYVQTIHNETIILIEKKNDTEKKIEQYKFDNIQMLNNKKDIENNLVINQKNIEYEQLEKQMEKDLDVLKEEYEHLEIDYENMRQNRKSTITKEEYEFVKKTFHEMEEEIDNLEKYFDIIEINNFPTYIFKLCCNNVTEIMNKILKSLNLTYSTEINVTTKMHSKRTISMIDIYKIHNEKRIDVSLSSSSEKFFINLSFKLALNCFLNISTPRIIIIDEMFECIDPNILNNIDSLFNKIHEYYNNIFIISHMYEIRKNCNTIITIAKQKDDSYIQYN
jgi:DNA repair exonuclease SbcCD ATPase subunit